ncbi:MAG: CoA transferase [Cellvibrionaceae bacterium]|nr:CoA transferase [Cellvibrionaceae bacterium]
MSTTNDGPLKGVKVLEATQFISGPFAGQQLADMGADVIKVERPGVGDPIRNYASGQAPQYGPNFVAVNRNKRSVTLDLQSEEGISTFKALAAKSDVVLENFRPGVMDRLGIGYEDLKKENPGIIYCAIAGFPIDGPYAKRPAFDTIGQASSGMLYLFTDPENPSLRGPTLSDQVSGLYAANAIQSALIERFRTEKGRRIDLSMMDASIAFMPDAFACYTEIGIEWDSSFRAAMSHCLLMQCKNNETLAIHMGGQDPVWKSFLKAANREDIITDPRFEDRDERIKNWGKLIEELRPVFAEASRSEWMQRLVEAKVPAADVLTIPEVLEDPAVKQSQLFETNQHPVAGKVTMMRRPALFDGERGGPQRPAALLGEHTEEVLKEYGIIQSEN